MYDGWTLTKIVPAITASSAYGAGNAVGPVQVIKNASGRLGPSKLTSLSIADADNQKAALQILLFSKAPTAVTDKATPTISAADMANCIGMISVLTTDYVTAGGAAAASKGNLQIMVHNEETAADAGAGGKVQGDAIYAVVVTTGTPTYAAVSSLAFNWGFEKGT